MIELLASFQILIADSCGMIFIENPSHKMFMIENNIVMTGFPFNQYPTKEQCLDMKDYPSIFKNGNTYVFKKEPNKQYQACFFNLSPEECEIIKDN